MKLKSNPFLRSVFLVASLACGITHTAFAVGNVTWTSGATADWSIAGNWTAGTGGTAPPAAGDSLIFATTSGVTTLNNDITALTSFGGITFNSGASAFTLNGNSITLGGNITNNAANTQKIGFAVDLASTNRNITVALNGRLELSGAWSRTGAPVSGNALTMNGAGTTAWTGNWNDTDISMAVSGGGTLEFNSASGGITGRRITVGNGTVSVLAGTHSFAAVANVLGDTASTTSTYNQSAGSMTMGTLNLAIGTVNMNLSGTGLLSVGTFTFGNAATQNTVAQNVTIGTGTGSGSTAEFRATTAFDWGNSAASTGRNNTVEVNGGKLSTVATIATNAASNAVLNIGNGGTLQARAASTTFLAGLDTFNIKNGGAKIDTQANNITISNNILNFSGAITDSLTKLGAGTLTLSGTGNTYSGGTIISEGTLKATNTGALPGFGSASKVSVANAATLALNYGGASDWASTNVDNLLSANGAGFASGSSLALDTTNASSGASYATNITIANLGLIKLGTTMLTLSGNNSYTGATAVSAGVLNVQHANALGTTAGGTTVASGAAIELQGGISFASEALSIDGVGVNGTGGTNNGVLRNVSGSNTWNGNITVGSESVSRIGADSGSTLTIAGAINLTGAATTQTTLQGDGSIIVDGKISGTGQLSSSSTGAGVRTLTNNANDYSSKTNLNGGRLRVGVNGALGASTVVFNGGALSSDGTTARTIANALSITGSVVLGNSTDNGKLTFTNASTLTAGAGRTWTTNSDAEFSANLDHTGGTMTKNGTGNLILTGGGTLARLDITAGKLTVKSGTYTLSNYLTLNNTTSATYEQTGGSVSMTGVGLQAYAANANSAVGIFSVSGGSFSVAAVNGLRFGAFTNGSGSYNVSGSGSMASTNTGGSGLYFDKTSGAAEFNLGDGTNFDGGSSINDGGTSGTLTVNKITRNAGSGVFNFNGGTLKASEDNTTFLADNTNITASVKTGGGIIDNNSKNITIDQNLLNGGGTDGGMVFKGSGTTTLTGAGSTYNGATTVTAGKLVVNGNISTSTLTTVKTGGTLGGSGTVGALAIANGGTLAPGNSPGTINVSGNLGLNDTSILDFELNPLDTTTGSIINDLVAITGGLTLDGLLRVTATSGNFLSVTNGTKWTLFTYSTSLIANNTLSFDPGYMPSLDTGLEWSIDTATTGQVNLVVVPEPNVAALLGGLGTLLLLRRRRA